jgi:hypothetical protein
VRRWRGLGSGSFAAAALLASLAGCAHPGRPGEDLDSLPVLAATPAELTARIDADAAAISGLKGALAVAYEEGAGRGARSCSAVLAARSPRASAGLYLKGYRSLAPTLFTLVSDGVRFWLHLPRDNVVYTGPVARRGAAEIHGIRLEARDLFRALFLEPVTAAGALDVVEEPSAYVVSVKRGGRLERRLWIERRRFTVRREAFYDGAGREELRIDRERWADAGGRPYPRRLRVLDAATGASVTLDLERISVNPNDLRADAFRPPAPAGARVVAVSGEEDGA